MKLSQRLLMDVPSHLTPSWGLSGMSMSSQTPGGDLEDMWSLDMIPDVRCCWNFHWHFWWMNPPIWHHMQVHMENSCPPRIQEEIWRTGKVLSWLLISDLDKTSYKLDKTSSQTIGPLVEPNYYITNTVELTIETMILTLPCDAFRFSNLTDWLHTKKKDCFIFFAKSINFYINFRLNLRK